MENFEITTLKNGLRVATLEMPFVESTAVSAWVRTGSRSENKQNSGISHFLEHMAFKGTPTRTAKQIAEAFDNIGGKVNAFTSNEATCYYAKVLSEHKREATEILADIFQNSIFPDTEITKEKEVVLQEISMVNDTPDEVIFDYFQNTAFPNQPAGMPILGTAENVKGFTGDDLKNYVRQKYHAPNVVISFAGKIKHDEALKLVNEYFNNVAEGEENKFEAAKYVGGTFAKEKKELEQTHIIMGFPGISYRDKNYYKLILLSSILGGGMSSRLFQRIREEMGLVYSIYSFASSHCDNGLFGIYAGTTPANVEKVISATKEELEKITKQIDSEELQRSMAQFKSSLFMSLESSSSMAQKIGSDLLCFNRVRTKDEILDELNAVSLNDIKASMEQLLNSNDKTFVSVGDVKGKSFV